MCPPSEYTALQAINIALDQQDSGATFQNLQNPCAGLPQVNGYAASLYHAELRGMKGEKQADLDYEELATAVTGQVVCCYGRLGKHIYI